MKTAHFSELAEGDLCEIWLTIAEDQVRNADQFIEALRQVAQGLAEQPLMGRARPELGKNRRSFPHGDYAVIYRPSDGGADIARIVHGARDIENIVMPRE